MTVPCCLREYIQLSRVYRCVYTCTYNVCIHVLYIHGGEVVMNDTTQDPLYSTSYIISVPKLVIITRRIHVHNKSKQCVYNIPVFNIQDACAARVIYSTWFSVSFTIAFFLSFFSGIELDGTTIGIAFTATMCNIRLSLGVVQDGGGDVNLRISTTAHELGHIFGMRHDDRKEKSFYSILLQACTKITMPCT